MLTQPRNSSDGRPFAALVAQGRISRDDFQAALAEVHKGGTDLEHLLAAP